MIRNKVMVSEGDELDDVDTKLGDPRADDRGEGETPTEQEINRANEYLPSAMGISALVRLPNTLRVVIRCGRYERCRVQGFGRPDKDGRWQDHWFRRPIEATIDIDCAALGESAEDCFQIPGQHWCRHIKFDVASIQQAGFPRHH